MNFFILLASVACFAAISHCAEQKLLRLPIKHIESIRKRLTRSGRWNDYIWKKQDLLLADYPRVNLTDQDDMEYVAVIQLGTPRQDFVIDMDTGSAELWVPDKTCNANCGSKHKFDSSASSTYVKNGAAFFYQYGAGSAAGVLGVDTLTIDGFHVRSQVFGQATKLDAVFGADTASDGILGLAYKTDNTPPVQNMYAQGVISQPVFSFWLQNVGDATKIGGELIFGGTDPTRYTGEFSYVPVTREHYWQYNIDSVEFFGEKISGSGSAFSDTGTSLIIGPPEAVDKIGIFLSGNYDPNQQLYRLDCSKPKDSYPSVNFKIGGKIYPVDGHGYVLELGNNLCYLGIQSFVGAPTDWVFGDTFIRDWYHLFDFGQNRVGFAKAVKK